MENNIAICIPTFKRPLMLQKLLLSISQLEVDDHLVKNITIIVMDNDINRSAEMAAKNFTPSHGKKIVYSHYPKKGLSNVRNALIQKALELNPHILVFVDDDQFVSRKWLHELIHLLEDNNSNVAVGPVRPIFEKKAPQYIAYWFKFREPEDCAQIDFLWTGNLAIRTQYLIDHPELRFDPRFNTTGGEDSQFGVQILKLGGSIRWAAKAITFETIPSYRANLKWLSKRAFRGANSYTFILMTEHNYLKIIKKIAVSCFYLAYGSMALVLTPFRTKYRYLGIIKIAESIGGLAAIIRIRYHEYATVRSDKH